MRPIAAIVLAAGFSRRLGRPKQSIEIGGRTLLQSAVDTALDAHLGPVLVVSNPANGRADVPSCVTALLNDTASEGIASSIRLGIAAARAMDVSGAVLLTCDQVGLSPDHLQTLASEPEAPAASAYAGRRGIPAYFPASFFPALLELSGDTGARDLLASARPVTNEELALDVDTEADLHRAVAFLAQRAGTQ